MHVALALYVCIYILSWFSRWCEHVVMQRHAFRCRPPPPTAGKPVRLTYAHANKVKQACKGCGNYAPAKARTFSAIDVFRICVCHTFNLSVGAFHFRRVAAILCATETHAPGAYAYMRAQRVLAGRY